MNHALLAPVQCANTSQTRADLSNILINLVRDHGAAFHSRARFRDGAEYNRERVHTAPDYEVWLLSWLPGQITPIHDHGGIVTVTTVLSGAILEERFERTCGPLVRQSWTTRRAAGDLDQLDPAAIHRVRPVGNVVTLHLYVPTCADGQIYQAAA
jgi:predicted metal-dependent enzyme (double-stranded beta helix superfamily)